MAQQLADRLAVLGKGDSPLKDRGEIVLSPAVGSRLLASLRPMFFGPAALDLARRFVDRRGCLASPVLTIVDDGQLATGLIAAPVDGEGVPNGRRVLLQDRVPRPPVVDWRQSPSGTLPVGAMQRFGWRDVPTLGSSHLYVEPPEAPPRATDLIASVPRGYYLVEITGEPVIDWVSGRFSAPVCGFVLDSGRARAPVAGAWLLGSVGSLLRGVQAVAGDLGFLPLQGMVGTPTLLVGGLELRSSPQ
jgi:predicted Zn-dependent protease